MKNILIASCIVLGITQASCKKEQLTENPVISTNEDGLIKSAQSEDPPYLPVPNTWLEIYVDGNFDGCIENGTTCLAPVTITPTPPPDPENEPPTAAGFRASYHDFVDAVTASETHSYFTEGNWRPLWGGLTLEQREIVVREDVVFTRIVKSESPLEEYYRVQQEGYVGLDMPSLLTMQVRE
jgi:hypothetical protein